MKPILTVIKSGLLTNHITGCAHCSAARFTGSYCEEGAELRDDLLKIQFQLKSIQLQEVA